MTTKPIVYEQMAVSGSEHRMYKAFIDGVWYVIKVPHTVGWRRLLGHGVQRAQADLDLIRVASIPHVPADIVRNATLLLETGVVTVRYAIKQRYVLLDLVGEQQLRTDSSVRRSVLLMLDRSLKMASYGRAIDFTGMEAATAFGKAAVLWLFTRRPHDLKLYNLHRGSERAELLDLGLLPTDGWRPVQLLCRLLAAVQHELLFQVIEPLLDDAERGSEEAQRVRREMQQRRRTLVGGVLYAMTRPMYAFSRLMLA